MIDIKRDDFVSFYRQFIDRTLYAYGTGIHCFIYGTGASAYYCLLYASAVAQIYNWRGNAEIHCFLLDEPKDIRNSCIVNSAFSVPERYAIIFRSEEIEKVIIQ